MKNSNRESQIDENLQQKRLRGAAYSNAMGDRIINALRELGTTRSVLNALGLADSTYYRWLRENPSLHVRAEIAKVEYRSLQDEQSIQQAKNWIKKLLLEGDVTIKKTVRQVVIREQVVEIHETSKIIRPCPSWVIDRILGMSELNPVQFAASPKFMHEIDRTGDDN